MILALEELKTSHGHTVNSKASLSSVSKLYLFRSLKVLCHGSYLSIQEEVRINAELEVTGSGSTSATVFQSLQISVSSLKKAHLFSLNFQDSTTDA